MERHLVPRHKQKLITEDTIAIRKMREQRRFSRGQAALLLGVSAKHIEAIENGRVQLTDSRIEQLCAVYQYSKGQYDQIKSGKTKVDQDVSQIEPRPKIIENNKLRRSYKRLINKKVHAIISLRHISGLSQFAAASRCGYAKCQFGHIENGRIELSDKRIRHIVTRLGFSMDDFKRELEAEKTTFEIRSECISLINGLFTDKLQTILALLKTLGAEERTKIQKRGGKNGKAH